MHREPRAVARWLGPAQDSSDHLPNAVDLGYCRWCAQPVRADSFGCSSHIERFSCPRSAPPSAPSVAGPSRGVRAPAGAVDGALAPPLSCPEAAHAGLVVAIARPVCFLPASSRVCFSSFHSALCASPSVAALARSASHRSARARMIRAAFTSASFSRAQPVHRKRMGACGLARVRTLDRHGLVYACDDTVGHDPDDFHVVLRGVDSHRLVFAVRALRAQLNRFLRRLGGSSSEPRRPPRVRLPRFRSVPALRLPLRACV